MVTYSVLHSGVPNAIRVFQELGITSGGIRIDSGDLAYLSRKARKMLDDAGLPGIKIIASNSLDEYIIRDLITQGARIDGFGVGGAADHLQERAGVRRGVQAAAPSRTRPGASSPRSRSAKTPPK